MLTVDVEVEERPRLPSGAVGNELVERVSVRDNHVLFYIQQRVWVRGRDARENI